MTRKEAPCLYCGESFEFVAGVHFNRDDHFGDAAGFESYKDWVAKEHDLDRNHEVFHTPGALTRPADFEKYEQLFR